jgi:2-hydroxychromene-2-carboxylate isomerase
MERLIEFYFDFISPFSYFANVRLPTIATEHRYGLRYHPVNLKQLKLLAGNTGPATREIPTKLAYARIDQKRWAERYGIPVHPPQEYDSGLLNKGVFFAADRQASQPYVSYVFHKVWGDGGPMTQEAFLRDICQTLGWDCEDFLRFVRSDTATARYDNSTEAAHDRGVFGVPSMMIGTEMWWGNDRLDFLQEFLNAG